MKIRAGFRIGYECQHDTAMLLVLNIHPSRRADLLSDQVLSFDRPIEAWSYLDSFGNACSRIVAPAGLTTISTEFEIYDDGMPDPVPQNAFQHEIKDLPDDVLVFLLGSRYCDTDRLADFAWKTFSSTPSAGRGCRRSSTLPTTTSPSTIRTPIRFGQLSEDLPIAPASAAISRISPSRFVAA